MRLKCLIGIHNWNGCVCESCKSVRNKKHDWSTDCESCSRCGKKARDTIHKCPDCGKAYSKWVTYPYCYSCNKYILHDCSKDCEHCSKCGKKLNDNHYWKKDCEKCSKCGHSREHHHTWDGCKCTKCGAIRNEYHDWSANCNQCSRCMTIRKDYHVMTTVDGCKRECTVCGHIIQIHHFNQCKCSKYSFIGSLHEAIHEKKINMNFKSILESLPIIKHHDESDYFQFNLANAPNIPLLNELKNLISPQTDKNSISYKYHKIPVGVIGQSEESISYSYNYAAIRRIDKEIYILTVHCSSKKNRQKMFQ